MLIVYIWEVDRCSSLSYYSKRGTNNNSSSALSLNINGSSPFQWRTEVFPLLSQTTQHTRGTRDWVQTSQTWPSDYNTVLWNPSFRQNVYVNARISPEKGSTPTTNAAISLWTNNNLRPCSYTSGTGAQTWDSLSPLKAPQRPPLHRTHIQHLSDSGRQECWQNRYEIRKQPCM